MTVDIYPRCLRMEARGGHPIKSVFIFQVIDGGYLVCFRLVLHAAVNLPLVYFAMVRRNPVAVIKGVYPALVTAFFLSSR